MNRITTLALASALLWNTTCNGSNGTPPSAAVEASSQSAVTLYPDYNIHPIAADMSGVTSTAMQLAGKIKLGLNIGNTLEATGGETAWGNPRITRDLVKAIKQDGFNAIRLPTAWNQHANQHTAKIDSRWLRRVKDVVQYCVGNGMYVIVNIHWDGGWLENHVTPASKVAVNARQKAYWQQIATALRDFDEHVMFASANEPNVDDAEQMDVLMSYHQTFINAVRATGGRNAYRVLIVQGPSTDITKTRQLMTSMPADTVPDRLMIEVHYYSPWNFAGKTSDTPSGKQFFYWGKNFHSTTDTAHNPTWGEEDFLDAQMALMKVQFIDRNIPVVMGEFGAVDRQTIAADVAVMSKDDLKLHHASRAYFFKYLAKQRMATGVLPFFWDTGGLISRTNYAVRDQQALDGLVQGANSR